MRGQGNIYSDVTFHFYEVGKRCWSRKRAVRDVPAWEAAVTARSSAEPGPGWDRTLQPHTGLGMGSIPGSTWEWLDRQELCRASPGLQEPMAQWGRPCSLRFRNSGGTEHGAE